MGKRNKQTIAERRRARIQLEKIRAEAKSKKDAAQLAEIEARKARGERDKTFDELQREAIAKRAELSGQYGWQSPCNAELDDPPVHVSDARIIRAFGPKRYGRRRVA